MKFLVALSCLLALASAKPSGIVAPLAYSVHAPATYAVAPSSFAYSTHTYAAPAVTYAAAPIAYAAPAPAPVAVPAPVAAIPAPAPVPAIPAHAPIAAAAVAAPAPVAYAAPAVATAPVAVPAVAKTQYHAQNELGQASYGHSEPFQAHNAIQDAAGNKVGSYSYVAPNGQVFSTNYVADGLGYRVASNALPVAPNLVPVGPIDTPEVVAARAAHLAEHAAAKHRARRSVGLITPAATAPLAYAAAPAPIAPLAYSAPFAYSTPVAYSSPVAYSASVAYSAPVAYSTAVSPVAAPLARAATLTTIVNTPGHAVSYRVD